MYVCVCADAVMPLASSKKDKHIASVQDTELYNQQEGGELVLHVQTNKHTLYIHVYPIETSPAQQVLNEVLSTITQYVCSSFLHSE